MNDFVGQPVYRCVGYTNIAFGRIVAQEMRGVWLWVRVDWEEDSQWVDNWVKIANVKLLDKPVLVNRIKNV
tara:strand:- start:1465 stop:1677 length:213 start_codon:yes stop_codon:yes gene_type:complete